MVHATVGELKLALAQTLHLEHEITRQWDMWHDGTRMLDQKPLLFYRIRNKATIDLGCKLLGGAGGSTDKKKPGKGGKSPNQVDDPVQAAFRVL